MVGGVRGQVNERLEVGGILKRLLAKNRHFTHHGSMSDLAC